MDSESRRKNILKALKNSETYINASAIAKQCGVTRQVIVADIAILRAAGEEIISTPRGYIAGEKSAYPFMGCIVCRHGVSEITDEFYTVVDYGGTVIDVMIEHPIYGEISAVLNINSRYDADDFVTRTEKSKARPLSALTEGVHIHNIGTQSKEIFDMIEKKLTEKGIIYNGK